MSGEIISIDSNKKTYELGYAKGVADERQRNKDYYDLVNKIKKECSKRIATYTQLQRNKDIIEQYEVILSFIAREERKITNIK